jgi:hypothetical protein
VVVAVGLTFVEPLAEVVVKVPGEMAMLVAPVVAQLSELAEPEFMVGGAAVKEVIAGAEPDPDDEFDCSGAVQPASPTQASSIITGAQGCIPETRRPRVLLPILQNEPAESMRSPCVVIDDIILATA